MASHFGEQRRAERDGPRRRRPIYFYGAVALAASVFATGASGSGCGVTINPGATSSGAPANSSTYSYSSAETFSFNGTNGNPDGQETIPAVPHCTDPAPAMPGLDTYAHNGLGIPKIPATVLEQLVCHAVEAKWPGDDAAWPTAFYLYYRESSFDNSEGDSEGAACTFAQFDPCSKLKDDFTPSDDITKALDYIVEHGYTNPEGAWQHELGNDWY